MTIPIETLGRLLSCDADAGKLFWRTRTPDMFAHTPGRTADHACANWNARFAGREAFTINAANGYLCGTLLWKRHFAHRIIWAMTHGDWPETVDHINGNRADNRISNLRRASRKENNRNCAAHSDNSSGLKGVSWDAARGKWRAQICHDGLNRTLGRFDRKEDALTAYVGASRDLHAEFGRAEDLYTIERDA